MSAEPRAGARPGSERTGIRLGLACIFRAQPIRFRRKTAASLAGLSRRQRLESLAALCAANAEALLAALEYCAAHGIGDFRVNSQILPLATHPQVGYRLEQLPGAAQITEAFRRCGLFAREKGLRTTFHPDQFVLLSSPSEQVTRHSLAELDYQAEVAQLIGADVINLHGGGGYGDKPAALARLSRRLQALPEAVRQRLTLENDDRVYGPTQLLPFCEREGVPFVYDVHHHRCLRDPMGVEEATERALATWDREPLFHLSSPRDGWSDPRPCPHHDYIDPADFPRPWLALGGPLTVEVEAKAKELAVARLRRDLGARLGTI